MDDAPLDIRPPLMVTHSLAETIDGERYANRVPSRAEAICLLIELGLETTRQREAA